MKQLQTRHIGEDTKILIQNFKTMKIYSNFIMKTLKNKLLIGVIATLGAFGNVNAQDIQDTRYINCPNTEDKEITIECWKTLYEAPYIEKVPCFEEDKNYQIMGVGLGRQSHRYVWISYSAKNNNKLVIRVQNVMQLEGLENKYLR